MNANSTSIRVDITSDFICPWCFIAERRLKQSARSTGVALNLHYHPFELNPQMPPDGLDRKTYRSAKFGSWAKSQELDQGTINAAAGDDLEFRYKRIQKTPNTLKAHQLIHYISQNNPEQEAATADRVFQAYFSEGKDIGQTPILLSIAAEFGLPTQEIEAYLGSENGTTAIRAAEKAAGDRGVRGVPDIQIGETRFSGALPEEVFVKLLEAHHQTATKNSL